MRSNARVPRITTGWAVTVGVLLLVGSGCRPPGARATVGSDDLERGRLVFEDDFERDALGERWSSGYAGWTLREGVLHVAGARNDALWLQEPLPEQFRVRFDAVAHSAEGDLKFEILGDGATHESGYIGIFGGWSNRLNIIARLDEHGEDRLVGAAESRVEPDRVYRFDVIRTDHRLRWYIDGDHFLTFEDAAPLRGERHRFFAFNDWTAPVAFDNLRVYDLAAP